MQSAPVVGFLENTHVTNDVVSITCLRSTAPILTYVWLFNIYGWVHYIGNQLMAYFIR